MDIYDTKAFVIRDVDYGESSKILTLFTKDRGIISVMAKGVKSAKSKKFNLVSVFTEANFELTEKNDFYFLKDGQIIESNLEIRKSIDKIYLAHLFFDIIERTSFNYEDENIYLLLRKSIFYLQKTDDSIRLANMFLLKYVSMIGFKPYLKLEGLSERKSIYFSLLKGRLINKSTYNDETINLSFKEVKYLERVLLEVLENIDDIENNIDEKKIFKLILNFIKYNLDITMPQSYYNFIKLKGID